jgi:6-phosphogluconolactonase
MKNEFEDSNSTGRTRFSAGGVKPPGRRKQMNLQKIKAVPQHPDSGEARSVRFSLGENRAKGSRSSTYLPWSRLSRIAKVSIGSLAMVFGLASCSLDYVVGYVYMTTNKAHPGIVNEYSIDFQSGALAQIGTVPAGNNPVRLVADPTGRYVYVVNQGDSNVQEFAVQSDGTLAAKSTYSTVAKTPTAIAIDPQGKFLYVTCSFQTGTSGPGAVAIFPVNSDNTLGTASTVNVGNSPVGVSVSYFNHYVYVLDQETSANAKILGFSQNTTTGALTPIGGAGNNAYPAGVVPSAIGEDLTARFVYVTDQAANQLIGYTVQNNGALVPMVNGPFQTGLYPTNLTVDPTGKLLYVVNYNANTVQGYAIDTFTGTPSGAVGAFSTSTGTGPTCVAIDPSLGTFLYTSNGLDNTITGERVTPETGALAGVQNSPFPGAGQPTCLTVVPNGSHASQIITP